MENRHGSSRAPRRSGQFVKNPVVIEAGSILIFALSVFALIALLTYNASDPSLFSNVHGTPHNACGRVGSFVASLALQCFGIGAFLMPVALFFMAATVHKREGAVRLVGTLGGMTAAVMSLTVFLTLQWKYWPYSGSLILTGGAFGAWVADILMRQFNPLGSSIVSLGVFFLTLAIATPLSVAAAGAHVLRIGGAILWRALKLGVTYLIYLLGLVAMRAAHGLGDFLQKLFEAAAHRARERAQAMKAKREIAVDSEVVAKPKGHKTPEIGLAGSSESEDRDEIEIGELKDAGKAGIPVGAEQLPLPHVPSEAPNALPELEAKGAARVRDAAAAAAFTQVAAGNIPQILPHDVSPSAQLEGSPVAGGSGKAPDIGAKVAAKLERAAKRVKRGAWNLPSIEFLRKAPKIEANIDKERLIANSEILRQKFADFGIDGEVTAVRPGPVITLYEFKPGPGIKVSRIASLADDLSMALSAQSVRILAPLPGKSVVGIEIPSDVREKVFLREFLSHPDFGGSKHAIPVVMGKDIAGQPFLSDMAKMPHLLAAGQTGSGKSVFMNGLICSLLYRFTPDELRMILVDPKFIEFRAYQDIPHLLLPVVDDPKHASIALRWAVREMERRYRILAKMGARNLASFNEKIDQMGIDAVRDLLLAEENQDETPQAVSGSDWIEAFEPDETGAPRIAKLPYIVVIIDELADLMMVAKKEVEISIARIAQKARAAGIHLVIATQRPSTDVITGLIKANLPSRVSFQLASYIDSKTILDRAGAERLLGQGDMLFIPPGVSQTLRLHGAYVDDEEISKITGFLRSQGKPAYRDEILIDEEDAEGMDGEAGEEDDELFSEAVELAKRSGHVSASFLQRHLKVGYNRAARMVETMESRGIVGPADGARPREVLIR